jgi:hypothetical protein
MGPVRYSRSGRSRGRVRQAMLSWQTAGPVGYGKSGDQWRMADQVFGEVQSVRGG